MSTSRNRRRLAESLVAHAQRVLPVSRITWAEAMKSELAHVESDGEALRWALGCVLTAYTQRSQAEFRCFTAIVKYPSGFLPLTMSLVALTVVSVHVAWFGAGGSRDEGATAHIWQLLMAAQLPLLAYFAIKWIPRAKKGAVYVLAAQIAGITAATAPVFLLHL